jgi:hypothetical protein
MSYQFYHDREKNRILNYVSPKGGTTFAVEEISLDAFNHLSKALRITVKLRVGIARCSEEDNYDKRIGRLISEARSKLSTGVRTFLVDEISEYGDGSRALYLTEEDGDLILVFKNSKDSKKVRLVVAHER